MTVDLYVPDGPDSKPWDAFDSSCSNLQSLCVRTLAGAPPYFVLFRIVHIECIYTRVCAFTLGIVDRLMAWLMICTVTQGNPIHQ